MSDFNPELKKDVPHEKIQELEEKIKDLKAEIEQMNKTVRDACNKRDDLDAENYDLREELENLKKKQPHI